MKRVYLFCDNGMSTSMMAQRMQDVADSHNLPIECKAFSYKIIQDIIEKNTLKETTLEALKSENFHIIALDFRPTAENMARYFHEKIKALGYNMHAVTVYETPTNGATYMEQC